MWAAPGAVFAAAVAPSPAETWQRSLPVARVLIVEPAADGFRLCAFDAEGGPAGDSWHETAESARQQAGASFRDRLTEWRPVLEGSGPPERLALAQAPALLAERRRHLDRERSRRAVVGDIRGGLYRGLLAAAHRRGLSALLVIRDVDELAPQSRELLSLLAPALIADSTTSEWPGSRLQDAEARVAHYALTEATTALLASAAGGLYDWMAPKLPEDLCFIRPDATAWLVSVAHERDAYVKLSEAELSEVVAELPGLAAHLDSPVGGVEIADDQVGPIWLRTSAVAGSRTTRLTISLRRGWDVDLLIDAGGSSELSALLRSGAKGSVSARTVDGESATVGLEGSKLRIVVPEAELDGAVVLGDHAAGLAAALDAAVRRTGR